MKSKINTKNLLGRYFHSFKDGYVFWQGCIIAEPSPGLYLVQLFEWLMGEPNVQRLVTLQEMKDWYFYPDSETMIFSYDYGVAKQKKAPLKPRPQPESESI